MKKLILFCALSLLLQLRIYPSDITLEAVRNVNGNSGASDYCMDSKPTPDGGTISAGYCSDGLSSFAVLIKYDNSGNQLWMKTYRNTVNGVDFYSKLLLDNSGNIFAIGGAYNAASNRDVLIQKYSSSGNILWTTFVNSSGYNYDTPSDCKKDNEGNLIIAFNEHESESHINAVKINPDGNILWQYRMRDTISSASILDLDEYNNVYISGGIESQFYTTKGILIKLNRFGNVKWNRTGFNETNIQFQYYTLKVIGNNEIYITDYKNADFLTYPVLQKFDSLGNLIWSKQLRLNMVGHIYTRSLDEDSAGNLVFINTLKPAVIQNSNEFIPGYLLGKYNAEGDSLWSRIIFNFDIYSGEDAYFKINSADDIFVLCFVREGKLAAKIIKFNTDGDSLASGNFYFSGSYGGIRSLNLDNSGFPVATGFISVKYNEYDYSIKSFTNNCQTLWESRYDSKGFSSDFGSMIAEDKDGNIFIAGGNNRETFVIKYNSMMNEQWRYVFNDSAGYDPFYKHIPQITIDNEGYVYLGSSVSSLNSGYDIKIIKLNTNGSLADSFSVIGSGNSSDLLKCIATDNDDNFYLSGNKGIGSAVYAFVSKYSKQGSLVWDAVFNFGGYTRKMTVDNGEVFLICDNNTAKINQNGQIMWVSYYQPNNHVHYFNDCQIDNAKNLIACGLGVFSGEGENIIIVKFDSSGNMLWDKKYNGRRGADDFAKSIAVDSADNIYVAGNADEYPNNFIACITVLKLDTAGNILWKKILSDPSVIQLGIGKVELDVFSNVYVSTGYEYSNSKNFSYLLVKYKSNGDSVWSTTYNHPDFYNNSYDFRITKDQNIIMTGKAYGSNTGYDITTLKYSQTSGIINISSQNPDKFILYQNYPNPFNPATKINYELRIKNYEFISMKIYDALGREVAVLVNQKQYAGSYEVEFDGVNLTSGVYFYSLFIDGNLIDTKKMLLLK